MAKIPTYDEAYAMYGADAMLGRREAELFSDLGCVTNTLDRNETISFNEYGATTNCGKNLLSKELLDSCIKRLQAISDDYDNYRIAFLNDREEAFRERCVKYASEYGEEENVLNAPDDHGCIYALKMLGYLTEDDLNEAREIIKKHSAEFTIVKP